MNHLTVSILAAALLCGGLQARAEHEKESKEFRDAYKSANDLIGKKVINAQDEDLGKVQDIIVNVQEGTAPYAVIAHGGVLGANRSKIAVALSSLRCAPDGKSVMLSATKEQLQTASKTPTGAWVPVATSEWVRHVDAFYGDPAPHDRYARERVRDANDSVRDAKDRARDPNDSRTYVRDPQPKGGELLLTPQDSALCEKICENLDVVHVRVHNGVTHLYGQVASEDARKNLETKVRSVPGVNTVESHLKVKNP